MWSEHIKTATLGETEGPPVAVSHCTPSSNKLGLGDKEQSQIAPGATGELSTAVIPPGTLPASKNFQLSDFPGYTWFLIT